jgi:hypothetical protein
MVMATICELLSARVDQLIKPGNSAPYVAKRLELLGSNTEAEDIDS